MLKSLVFIWDTDCGFFSLVESLMIKWLWPCLPCLSVLYFFLFISMSLIIIRTFDGWIPKTNQMIGHTCSRHLCFTSVCIWFLAAQTFGQISSVACSQKYKPWFPPAFGPDTQPQSPGQLPLDWVELSKQSNTLTGGAFPFLKKCLCIWLWGFWCELWLWWYDQLSSMPESDTPTAIWFVSLLVFKIKPKRMTSPNNQSHQESRNDQYHLHKLSRQHSGNWFLKQTWLSCFSLPSAELMDLAWLVCTHRKQVQKAMLSQLHFPYCLQEPSDPQVYLQRRGTFEVSV